MGLFDRFRKATPSPASESEPEPEPPRLATPDQLQELFDAPSDTAIIDQGKPLTVEHLDVGELAFPSGRVAFCDPLVGDGELFVTVAPGTTGRAGALGVRLAPDHRRVAALALELAPGSVASWKMYVPDGRELEEGMIWGFGVDAGVACFADPDAIQALHAESAAYYDQTGPLTGREPIVDDMYGADDYKDVLLYETQPGLALAISQSGWGDGTYATYVGTDADGRTVRLMISFDVLSADYTR